MFLKNLKIEDGVTIIRDISFHKGLNLIIDETGTKISGNNIGKTTVLKLVDFCLGSNGKDIYQDHEFKERGNNTKIENFLKDNNVIISLSLVDDLQYPDKEIIIRRNFLGYRKKIQEINGETIKVKKEFGKKLKELIFNSKNEKPTFFEIKAKNIRYKKNRIKNTINVLHNNTTKEAYEALYFFWLGININELERKQVLQKQKQMEEKLQERLKSEHDLPQIEQSIIVIERIIKKLEQKKNNFNINEDFKNDLSKLNSIKANINSKTTEIGRLEIRFELIKESENELKKNRANINLNEIKSIYKNASRFIKDIHVTYEQTVSFHNNMLNEKINFITKELPKIKQQRKDNNQELNTLLSEEKQLSEKLNKAGALEDLQDLIVELNENYERKGGFEEQKRLWQKTNKKFSEINKELKEINKIINSKDDLIKNRVSKFNVYFEKFSHKLYKERLILSHVKDDRAYSLKINSMSPGTGKKKGEIAAFDFAHIKFCESIGIKCLNFILHDQIENIYHKQINTITEIANKDINCQYIVSVLRDKLPTKLDVEQYKILSLSQEDKLFRVE